VGIIRTTISRHPIENTDENLNYSTSIGISYANPEAMRILGLGNHENTKLESACLGYRYQDNRQKFREIQEDRGCGKRLDSSIKKKQESFVSCGGEFSEDSGEYKLRAEKVTSNQKVRMNLWEFLHLKPSTRILSD
jgi:hypothetical protein